MPFVDKDHFNRRHLPEVVQKKQAVVDALDKAKPPGPESIQGQPNRMLKEWQARRDKAAHEVEGLEKVEKSLTPHDGKPRFLGLVDDKGHASISVNDPDKATRNATFVPGTFQDLSRVDNADGKSSALIDATRHADKSLKPQDVSVTTWMGYDRPMGIVDAGSTEHATNSAGALDDFQSGLRASHEGATPSINTVIGHSYGSTMVGAAASGGHHLDADQVIAVGSPGMLVDKASELDLNPGAPLFASRADHDVIMYAEQTTLGPSPATTPNFGERPFDSDPGPAAGPSWLKWLGFPGGEAHGAYFDQNSTSLLNMGDIISGHDPSHTR